MRAYIPAVSCRALLSFLAAIAMLFTPAFAPAVAASVGPVNHHEQMMMTGHCESMPDGSMDGEDSKSCCIALCLAVAVVPSGTSEPQDVPRSAKTYLFDSFAAGVPPEIATPPPRSA